MTTLQPNRAACIEQRAETYLAASNGNDGFPALKNGRSWRFAEDVPGKPGWISESSLPWRPGEAGDIAFSVQTADASHPAVSLTYLRSYHTPTTRMGRLAVNITCHQTTHHIGTLDGAWDDLVSLETTFDFSGFSELGGGTGENATDQRSEPVGNLPTSTPTPAAPRNRPTWLSWRSRSCGQSQI